MARADHVTLGRSGDFLVVNTSLSHLRPEVKNENQAD